MPHRSTLFVLAVVSLLAAGCTDDHDSAPQTVQREAVLETMATVDKVDQATREVQLRTLNGELETVAPAPRSAICRSSSPATWCA